MVDNIRKMCFNISMFVVSNIEETLAYNCAPCFSGLKPSSLVSLSAKDYEQISCIDEKFLIEKGFFIKVLCSCKKRVQVLIYNKRYLETHFADPAVSRALQLFYYPENSSIEEKLNILALRMSFSQEPGRCKHRPPFPHEIGLFLGYPVDDVFQYVRTGGKNCLFCGYWKVYSNPERALQVFHQYTECKERFALQIKRGMTLSEIVRAA